MKEYIYRSIFLMGFRAVGKSTVGKILASKLGWKFYEMDKIIEKNAGMSINDLTKNGTDWYAFRRLEYKVLKRLLEIDKAVVSCGGGVGVNDIKILGTDQSFGERETYFLKKDKTILKALLTAPNAEIENRIKRLEFRKFEETHRPILDKESEIKYQIIKRKFAQNPKKLKQEIVKLKVQDNMKVYNKRKYLYNDLTKIKIYSSYKKSPEEMVNVLLKKIVK